MGETTKSSTENTSATTTDKLYMENTLLRVFGVLFCHDPKRARTRTGVLEVERGLEDKRITIRLDSEYHQPGPFAHKIALAIIKKQSGYGRPVQRDISFSQRELLHLSGRKALGGRDSDELVHALKQIRYTHVITHFRKADRFLEHDFSIFNEVLIERRHSPTDPIVACSVSLADPIVTSLQDGHFTCLNHFLMQRLSTISQALYMRLFFHFSHLYDGHHKKRLSFPKRYDNICTEWLGGLTVQKHQSIIERDQLGPHLRQLVQAGVLASYTIASARTREGFVITFRPGATFFADYDRFYRHRTQRELQFDFSADQRDIGEPLKLAYTFAEKRTGQQRSAISYVSSKEVETAKDLLDLIPAGEGESFVDYALAEAKKTNFDVRSLGGVKQYLDGYLAARERRAADKTAMVRRQVEDRQTQQRMDYDSFRHQVLDDLFASLPASEQTIIEQSALSNVPTFANRNGPVWDSFLKWERRRATTDRYSDRIPSFEEWLSRRNNARVDQFP
jgi:Replication initiator protein A